MRLLLFFCVALFADPARAEFGAHLGSHFEFGSMGGEAADVYESRSMGAFGLQAMPGYRFLGKAVLAGMMLDLRFFSQLASGTTVEFGGKSFLLGPAVAYEGAKLKLLLGWDLRARHSTSTPMATYKGSGIRVLIGYRLGARLWGDLQYVTTKYKMVSVSNVESSLEDNPIKTSMIGFGLSYSY
jgi:hypothetical protein